MPGTREKDLTFPAKKPIMVECNEDRGGTNTAHKRRHGDYPVFTDSVFIAPVLPFVRLEDMAMMKKCCRCRKIKPRSAFHRHSGREDGLHAQCKACRAVYYRKHYLENQDRIIAKDRAYRARHRQRGYGKSHKWYIRNKVQHAASVAAYAAAYPERRLAVLAVFYAKATGICVATPCEICGTTEDVQAHHEDYSKPLDVRWLCRSHHLRLHAERRRKEAG